VALNVLRCIKKESKRDMFNIDIVMPGLPGLLLYTKKIVF
jgi:hypothetical protein